LGFILGFGALLYAILIAFAKITGLIVVSGWSSMMTVILLVSSFQMISIGVLGEYLWRTLDSSRNRPIYLIDKVIFKEQD
jgi:hypothetical protein